jgi:hypothetical protein
MHLPRLKISALRASSFLVLVGTRKAKQLNMKEVMERKAMQGYEEVA